MYYNIIFKIIYFKLESIPLYKLKTLITHLYKIYILYYNDYNYLILYANLYLLNMVL